LRRAPTAAHTRTGAGGVQPARYSAAQIPGARFLGFDSGGHLLLGHRAEVVAAVQALMH
jgi:2-hydroxy-6-oxonona-2,4-dienedioate hydrolase